MFRTTLNILFYFTLIISTSNYLQAQNIQNIERHLSFLGSDLFEGRGTGTIGGELAAKYIALNLNKYELIPLGYENTFYQYIPMHETKPSEKSSILTSANDTLIFNEDFQFIHISGRIFTPNYVPLVFAGYGIDAPEYNYDDYDNVDVVGKIVVYLEGEPYSENQEYFQGDTPSTHYFSHTKQKVALSKGAIGSIQIPNMSCKSPGDWERVIREYSFVDITLAYLPTPTLSLILNPKSAHQLFENSQYSYEKVIEMSINSDLISFELDKKLLLKFDFARRDFVAPNIIGFVEGSDDDLQNEFILISAHYDHLGIGFPVENDSIYNGVLDNAIGVSALLELARMFSEEQLQIKRSILFVFLTGEEKGLLGATYFCDYPLVPIEKIIANVNIDGLAVFGDFNSIVGIGSEYSSLNKILQITGESNDLKIEKIPKGFASYESFLRSDQLAFAIAGIPSILISDGTEIEGMSREEVMVLWKDYIQNRYHTPFDDLNQEIDLTASAKHIQILFDFIKELTNTDEEIDWYNSNPLLESN